MAAAATINYRRAKDTRKKISDYEGKFKHTHAWATATSAGVREQDGEATFNDAVTKNLNTT